MATYTKTTFAIHEEQFFGGMNEVLTQQSNVFNEASNGAIRFVTDPKKGDFEDETFLQRVPGLVSRRNIDVVTAADKLDMTQETERRVKLNQKIGPVDKTRDAWRKIGANPEVMSFALGEQTAKAVQVRNLNLALIAAEAALDGVVDLEFSATGSLDYSELADGLNKLGDNSRSVVAWAMHSKVATDLLKQAIADKITNVADVAIREGSVFSLNRPVIITDSPALIVAGSPNNYVTLGLVEGAVSVVQSEEQEIMLDDVSGLENLVMRLQGEYAVNVGVKGFKWGSTINPTDVQLGTSSNWTKVAASHKSCAGIRILST